jgi:hypothetical protein
MAVSRSHAPKQPSQNPTAFYKGEQSGGAYGKPTSVPEKLSGGPMREKVYGGGGAGMTNKSK